MKRIYTNNDKRRIQEKKKKEKKRLRLKNTKNGRPKMSEVPLVRQYLQTTRPECTRIPMHLEKFLNY